MTERVLVDNDVILKTACYALADEMLQATTVGAQTPAMLGVGRFVVRGRLEKAGYIANRQGARDALEKLLASMTMIEPDDAELALAAEMEAAANRVNLELDGGESQLLAVLANRGCDLLLTGDKRAIAAMAVVAATAAATRIACLEQLIAQIVANAGAARVREGVCAEPRIDRAVTACFGCSSDVGPSGEDVAIGLDSYVRHVDRSAPGLLLPGPDLAGLTV